MEIEKGIRPLTNDEVNMVAGAGFIEEACRVICITIQVWNGNLNENTQEHCFQVCS